MCGKLAAELECDVFESEKHRVWELGGKKVLGNRKIRKNRILRDSRDSDADPCCTDDGDAESVLGVAVSCLVRELQVKQDLGFFWGSFIRGRAERRIYPSIHHGLCGKFDAEHGSDVF